MSIVLLLLIALYSVFLFSLKYDRWDGTIIDYWLRSGDFRGIEIWFAESGGPITLLELRAFDAIIRTFDLHVHFAWFSVVGIIFYALGTVALARAMEFDLVTAILAAIILLLSPILTLTASSLPGFMIMHVGFCWIGLWMLERGRVLHVASLIFLALSCQLWSNFATIVAFIGYRTISARRLKVEYVSAIIVTGAVIAYLLVYTRPTGLYANYNSFKLESPLKLAWNFFTGEYARLLLPPFIIYLYLEYFRSSREPSGRSDIAKPLWLAALFLAGTAPYVLVGKHPPETSLFWPELVQVETWWHRHLFSVYGWICIIVAAAIISLYDIAYRGYFRRPIPPLMAAGGLGLVLTAASIVATAREVASVRLRDFQSAEIVRAIPALCPDRNSICYANIENGWPNLLRLNYLYVMAMGKRGLLIDNSWKKEHIMLNKLFCRSEEHAVKYMIDYSLCSQLARETSNSSSN